MTILVLSGFGDVHAHAVLAAIAARGATGELVDLSEFPAKLSLTMAFDGGGRSLQLHRSDGGGAIDLASVSAVWWRRPQPFAVPAAVKDEAQRRFALSKANTTFHGMYQSLDAFWLNEPSRDATASHKPYQLKMAQEVGLEIPPTLMTNDPEAARAFWARHPGEVIYKQFIALPDTWRETRRVGAAEERLDAAVSLAPVIFQRHVPAVADLRIVVVGDRLFAAAADVRAAAYPQDVRMNLNARYEAHALPDAIAGRVRALTRRLGLVYGAVDMRLTPEGRYVFLEINPAGQFLYIEQSTGQPIAAAVAECLIAGTAADPAHGHGAAGEHPAAHRVAARADRAALAEPVA